MATINDSESSAIMALADNVKRLRAKHGMSQQDLAERIGSSYPRISEIEHGRANPTLDTLQRLAEALNTSVDRLVKIQKT